MTKQEARASISLCEMCDSKLYEAAVLRDGEWQHPMNHGNYWVKCSNAGNWAGINAIWDAAIEAAARKLEDDENLPHRDILAEAIRELKKG